MKSKKGQVVRIHTRKCVFRHETNKCIALCVNKELIHGHIWKWLSFGVELELSINTLKQECRYQAGVLIFP